MARQEALVAFLLSLRCRPLPCSGRRDQPKQRRIPVQVLQLEHYFLMAHFAQINDDNVVVNVIVAELSDFVGGPWSVLLKSKTE